MNHYISTNPTTGQVATRSSATRTYTHAVWGTWVEGTHGNPAVGTEPVALSWAGRPDLADKAAALWRNHGWADVTVVEAVQVATKAEQKRAVELAKFNLTTTDGESYSLTEAREVADTDPKLAAFYAGTGRIDPAYTNGGVFLLDEVDFAPADPDAEPVEILPPVTAEELTELVTTGRPVEIDHAQATAVQVAPAAPFTYQPKTLRIDSIVCFGPSDRPKTLGTVRSNDWALANALQVPPGAVAIEGQHRFWFARPIPGSSVRRFGLSCVKVLVHDIETTVAEVTTGSFTIVGTIGKVVTFDGVQAFYTRPENVVEVTS